MVAPAKKIAQARIGLMWHYPFFGYLAVTLDPIEDENLNPPTMATDGVHLYFHPEFVAKMSIPELQGVIVHEIGHVILNHITRRMGREPLRFNMACDLAINWLVLQEPGLKLPEGVLIPPTDWENKTAEWLYNEITVKKIPISGAVLDNHEMWDQIGQGQPGKPNDPGQSPGQTQQGKDALEAEWRQRVAQAATQARMKGKLPAHLESIVGELLQPKLDWKTMLRDMVTSCAKSNFRYTPPNKKHLYRGFYLPSITGEEIRIAVCIDSSGSISDEEIREFLSEVKGICDSYDDYTIYGFIADAVVHQRFELHPMEEEMPRKAKGRGGTSFVPALAEAEKCENISAIVYFTDLYGTFPAKEPTIPVIWVSVTPKGQVKVPWGFVIEYPRIAK